jgi:hypothetical protein
MAITFYSSGNRSSGRAALLLVASRPLERYFKSIQTVWKVEPVGVAARPRNSSVELVSAAVFDWHAKDRS